MGAHVRVFCLYNGVAPPDLSADDGFLCPTRALSLARSGDGGRDSAPTRRDRARIHPQGRRAGAGPRRETASRERCTRGLRAAEQRIPLRAAQGSAIGERSALVRLSLVPKEQDYFRMFSELAANLDAAAQLLVKFMEGGDRKSIAAAILEHEHVGDNIVHDIVRRLNKSFITPIDREDIYDLVATTDEILDSIEEVTGKVQIYRVDEIMPFALQQAQIIAKATPILRECMDNLEKPKGLDERIIAINSLENDGDRIEREALESLFERDTKCTDIIKWKDLYETLERAIDECEHVANVIESIVLKHN